MIVVYWPLDILGRGLRGSTAFDSTECTKNYVILLLLHDGTSEETSEKMLLWLRTKSAMMMD